MLSQEDRQVAADRLGERFSEKEIISFFPPKVRPFLPGLVGAHPNSSDYAERLLLLYDAELLRDRARRDMIAAKAEVKAPGRWCAGKGGAAYFVKRCGLPESLAGLVGEDRPPSWEDVEPYVHLNPLHDFQAKCARQALGVLRGRHGMKKAILSLPTGAGKTRTMVHALVERIWDMREDEGPVIWIAQSEELVEQAIESIRQVWLYQSVRLADTDRVRRTALRIQRVYGGHDFDEEGCSGIAVCSIQTLHRAVKGRNGKKEARQLLEPLFRAPVAVVIDEAHHATAPSYRQVIREFTKDLKCPVIGLTATPGRRAEGETKELANWFDRQLIAPPWANPHKELEDMGVLAHIKKKEVAGGSEALTDKEQSHYLLFKDLPETAVERLGMQEKRNERLRKEMRNIAAGRPTLVFAASVVHAQLLALLLREDGRTAAVVESSTPQALRRKLIEEFRRGEIQFLCNYGVLTTGFDAPKVEVVVLARPTTSPILYEQMLGRGLRGPKNGGKAECEIIDVVDMIEQHGHTMSYTRYRKEWESRSKTGAFKSAPEPSEEDILV